MKVSHTGVSLYKIWREGGGTEGQENAIFGENMEILEVGVNELFFRHKWDCVFLVYFS